MPNKTELRRETGQEVEKEKSRVRKKKDGLSEEWNIIIPINMEFGVFTHHGEPCHWEEPQRNRDVVSNRQTRG